MGSSARHLATVTLAAIALSAWTSAAQAGQTGRRPDAQGQQDQPAAPPRTPRRAILYASPADIQQVQIALKTAGFPPGRVDGAWDEAATTALIAFQRTHGIDASGHVDLMTLVALGLPGVLTGEAPAPASGQAVAPSAANQEGTPLYASPASVRKVQEALDAAAIKARSEATPDNILGVWHDGTAKSAAAFQAAHGLAPTGTLDLELFHALGLDELLAQPKPARVLMLTDAQAPFAGAPLELGPAAVRLVQQALAKDTRQLAVDGHWKEEDVKALGEFQQTRHLEPTGALNLRTIRALGFAHPLVDLAQAGGPPS